MEVPNEEELKEVVVDIKKEYDVVEKVGAASEEGTLIKSTVKKPLKSQRMMPNHPR